MADTETSLAAILKEKYSGDDVLEILYESNPLYSMVKKEQDFEGLSYFRTPLISSTSGATSHNFAKAKGAALVTATGAKEFRVDRVSTYSFNTINDVVVLAAKSKGTAAFISATEVISKGAIYKLGRDIAISLYREGYGSRGQVSLTEGSVTGTVITLAVPSDVSNFEVDNFVEVAASLGAAARTPGSNNLALGTKIIGIDREAGTLTFANNVNSATDGVSAAIAQGDQIGIAGDFVASTRTKPAGLAAYLPMVAPTAGDNLFGLDRSSDPERLAGIRINGTSLAPVEQLNTGMTKVSSLGGKVSHFFVSFNTYTELLNSYQSIKRIVDNTSGQAIGYSSFEVFGPMGKASVVADINCPDDRIYGLQLNTWKLATLGDPFYKIGTGFGDGLTFTRLADYDAWEIRLRFSGGLRCFAPGKNCVISR